MVAITHHVCGKAIQGRSAHPSVLITNSVGSFLHLGTAPTSKYQGFFVHDRGSMIKILENFEREGDVEQIENDYHSATLVRDHVAESYFMPFDQQAVVYESSKPVELSFMFDIRSVYDERTFGRHYVTYEKDGIPVVKFMKKTDDREDSSHDVVEFTTYVAIVTNGMYNCKGTWVRRWYEDDASRSGSGERYVYNALRAKVSKAVVVAAGNEEDAIAVAKHVFKKSGQFKKERRLFVNACVDGQQRAAAYLALNSLITPQGIFAGLPWFFQVWSRDQFISLSPVHHYLKKVYVMKYIHTINAFGRVPNVKGSTLASSDGVGWLFVRAEQLVDEKAFNKRELSEIASALEQSLSRIEDHCMREGFVFSDFNESWMDTSFNDGGRRGFPIEIQCLTLAQYRLLNKLKPSSKGKKKEAQLAKLVKQHFWNGQFLADLKDDFTIRPNVFLAYYAYPQLLSKSEWEACFDTVLPKLWCEWGGLSSIDKNHPLFQPHYTGQDNRSYHRGDSWYWVNNIAAIVMHRVNAQKFGNYISKIKDASVNDLLWLGAIGHCSEVSSAAEQTASGCLSQAWSAATLIELFEELDRRDNS